MSPLLRQHDVMKCSAVQICIIQLKDRSMKGHSVVGCKAIHVRERPEVKADKNRVQAAPVTKVIATVIVQETIIYARYSGPCNNTSPTKFPNGSRRNISKDQLSEWDARECTAVGPCMSMSIQTRVPGSAQRSNSLHRRDPPE